MRVTFPIQLAKEAVLLSQYAGAVEVLHRLAAGGVPEAQFLVGYLHFLNSEPSKPQALDLLRQAAAQGHAEAKYVLATCPALELEYGFALPDSAERMLLLQEAAALGSLAAKVDLAKALVQGKQIKPDRDQAKALLTEVTERRHPIYAEACYRLGMLLLEEAKTVEDTDNAACVLRYVAFDRDVAGNPYIIRALDVLRDLAEQQHLSKQCLDDVQNIQRHYEPKLRAAPLHAEWQSYLTHYCLSTLHYNLTQATFEEFLAFHFEHWLTVPAPKNVWSKQAQVTFDSALFYQHYLRLFRDPAFLLTSYPTEALDQGLWEMRYLEPWSVGIIMFSVQVTEVEAEALIRSFYDLFEKLFAVNALTEHASYMWWESPFDLLPPTAGARGLELRANYRQGYGKLLQVAFETLTEILRLDSRACQDAALHGLGHLHHPDRECVILQFLMETRVSRKLRNYAYAAIDGKML
jgi:hypothetical protein